MKSSKKVKVYAYLCFLVVFLLIYPVIANAKSVHLILVKYDSEMKSVGSKTYVERSMEPFLQEGILEDIKVSTEAIANVFGGKSASPFLVFVQSDQGHQKPFLNIIVGYCK